MNGKKIIFILLSTLTCYPVTSQKATPTKQTVPKKALGLTKIKAPITKQSSESLQKTVASAASTQFIAAHPQSKGFIDRILNQEKKFPTYTFFYHVQPFEYRLVQDLTTALYTLEYKKTIQNYSFLRFYKNKKISLTEDNQELSTSPSLFAKSLQEQPHSFTAFLKPTSSPQLGKILHTLLQPFIKNAIQRAYLVAVLHLLLETVGVPQNDLLQIGIPASLVPHIASHKGTLLSLSSDVFVQPSSGIVLFHYSTLTAKKEILYKKIISIIAQFIYEKSEENS